MLTTQSSLDSITVTQPVAGTLADMLRDSRQLTKSIARLIPEEEKHQFAQQFTASAISAYWQTLQSGYREAFPLPEPPTKVQVGAGVDVKSAQAAAIGRQAAALEPIAAGYILGEMYTSLLPNDLRARHGIYYTPPPLTRRLLALATAAGVDWTTCRVLDPACGGGAFLIPVALRMIESLPGCPPLMLFRHLSYRLRGAEIDPFSAWMSQTLLEVALFDLCHVLGRRLPQLITVCDSLQHEFGDEEFGYN